METIASPTKRRVLGSLDPNASPRPTRLDAKQVSHSPNSPLKKVTVFSASPSQPEQGKRPLLYGEVASEPLHPAKKLCHEDSRRDMAVQRIPGDDQSTAQERRQSASPEASSLFDNSAIDTSQATTVTEPDVVAVTAAAAAAASTLGLIPRPATRPRLTREEAREKAEILKLRLGLASYKLRTGQTGIPLEQLEEMQQSAAAAASSSSSFGQRLGGRRSRDIAAGGGAGWASSRLQAQLQVQRAQLAAAGPSPSTGEGEISAAVLGRRPLPADAAAAGHLRRSSTGGAVRSQAGGDGASFSSQVRWSQGSSQEDGGAVAMMGGGEEGGEHSQVDQARDGWRQQTPRRQEQPQQFRVEVGEEMMTSSALRGGAASGLLSLAHAGS